LPVTSDFIFKLIFGDQKNTDILTGFLKTVLDIPEDEYEYLTITDPHLKKESMTDKFAILDVKVHTKNKNVIQVEIQVKSIPDMKPRAAYSQSKMVTEQISSGQNWSVIKRVVSIVITNYPLITENNKYHNQFRYRSLDGTEFTDLMEINTLELNKIPPETDNTELWPWVKFIKSDDEGVLDMIAEKSPEIKKAVGVLRELSANERMRLLYEQHEIARRDYESRLEGAIKDTKLEVFRSLINMGSTDDFILKALNLTPDEFLDYKYMIRLDDAKLNQNQ